MGQIPQCSSCIKEKEKEENLIASKASDFSISQSNTKNISLTDHPTLLKTRKLNQLIDLSYKNHDSYIVQEGFGLIYFKNNSIFKGLFHKGIPNGWGIYLNPINQL